MVTRDAKEYPETISGEIQGGRPLHFLRLLSRCTLLEYGTMIHLYRDMSTSTVRVQNTAAFMAVRVARDEVSRTRKRTTRLRQLGILCQTRDHTQGAARTQEV